MNLKTLFRSFLVGTAVLSAMACSRQNESSSQAQSAAASPQTLTIYSSRQEQLLSPILERYTAQTGTEFKLHTGKEGPLIQQMKSEGEKSPADIFITVDAANLWYAANEGLLAPTKSDVLSNRIPSHLRDPEGRWFGFSIRARTIFYNPNLVQASELSSYEDLAEPKWKGKLCLRTSKKVYNQSLVSSLILHHGEEKANQVVEGWVNNLATNVFSNDTDLLKAIDAGQCAVGIANTYYFGRLQRDNPNINIKAFWANQENSFGTHVNISGAGILTASKNKEAAKKFFEWLAQDEAQKLFAELNMEYPVIQGVEVHPLVSAWGSFQQDLIDMKAVGELQTTATRLMDRAQYK